MSAPPPATAPAARAPPAPSTSAVFGPDVARRLLARANEELEVSATARGGPWTRHGAAMTGGRAGGLAPAQLASTRRRRCSGVSGGFPTLERRRRGRCPGAMRAYQPRALRLHTSISGRSRPLSRPTGPRNPRPPRALPHERNATIAATTTPLPRPSQTRRSCCRSCAGSWDHTAARCAPPFGRLRPHGSHVSDAGLRRPCLPRAAALPPDPQLSRV